MCMYYIYYIFYIYYIHIYTYVNYIYTHIHICKYLMWNHSCWCSGFWRFLNLELFPTATQPLEPSVTYVPA